MSPSVRHQAPPTPSAVQTIQVVVLPDGRMDRENAAKYLGLNARTLCNLAVQKAGPRYVRVRGRVYYFLRDLDAYIQAATVRAEA
ncbi:hypothetical protein amb3643 [Paramagnetospirillum magneticum AMB-1]|uniref:Helix-turn-helix domain-containing protein n=1 Tax=Paramagnetospirillum magneticum (strain ATCC 700264 / AMB-1) TaxID=342108 RepID=Q2W128_PARM1|nr:hypothetical protein amb3643 [Paramagnetospirillum magneticum AMB-1]